MPNELDPIVGQWYLHRDKGEMFRVMAVDAPTVSSDIQSFDGDVEEGRPLEPYTQEQETSRDRAR